MAKPPNRRPAKRKYQFIERKQQFRFAVTVALFSLLLPGFMAGMVLSPFVSSVLIGDDAEDVRLLLLDLGVAALNHWWVVLMALLFVGVCSVVFSHKLFGPIRRFETALTRKRWHPEERVFCSLRQGDYFKDFSLLLQRFLDTCEMPEPPAETQEPTVVEVPPVQSEGKDAGKASPKPSSPA